VERRGTTGDQCGLKDFKQFLPGGAEAYGPPHVGHQALAVSAPVCQEGDGHEFAHLGRDVASFTQGQLVDPVVCLSEVGIRPGCKFPLGLDVPSCRLHARNELLRLRGSVVVAHVVSSEVRGLKPLGHQRRPEPLGRVGDDRLPPPVAPSAIHRVESAPPDAITGVSTVRRIPRTVIERVSLPSTGGSTRPSVSPEALVCLGSEEYGTSCVLTFYDMRVIVSGNGWVFKHS
jgi:hypothetical protein